MADYTVEWISNAERDLKQLDAVVQRRVLNRLEWLRINATSITHAELTGQLKGLFKVRVGDYRVLYEKLDHEQLILVFKKSHIGGKSTERDEAAFVKTEIKCPL